MVLLVLLAAAITLAVGYAAKVYLEKTNSEKRITNKEFIIAGAVMLVLVIPGTAYVGRHMAINNQVTFTENWTGWETGVTWEKIKCERDGWCKRCYDCDPYKVEYDCSYYEDDGKGGRRRVQKTCERTEYHSCPYTDYEWTFVVHTTLGDYTIAWHNLPTDPDNHRWRRWVRVPSHYASGVPDFWQRASERLKAGNPGPVTARKPYANYILASQSSILKRFNSEVEQYSKAKLFPEIAQDKDVYGFYFLNRAYFVGVNPPPGDWQAAINRFNGAFGTMLQGDLHLVVVDANKIDNPDNYAGALTAYWQSEKFEKQALSKNGVVVVLGTKDGKTVDWARATTGMPMGNEHLLLQLQYDLKGVALDPQTLLGNPSAQVLSRDKVSVSLSTGVLENILWGKNKFERVRMGGDDGESGFKYLLTEIEPTTGQMIGILVAMLFFATVAWGICIVAGDDVFRRFRR
jgi:hypothetical protein